MVERVDFTRKKPGKRTRSFRLHQICERRTWTSWWFIVLWRSGRSKYWKERNRIKDLLELCRVATAQLHSTKSELRLCTGSNPTCGMSEIQLKMRLNVFSWWPIPQKQFFSIIISSKRNRQLKTLTIQDEEDVKRKERTKDTKDGVPFVMCAKKYYLEQCKIYLTKSADQGTVINVNLATFATKNLTAWI